MQGKSTNIKFTNQLYLSVKAVFKYCLVLFFAFAFSLQQFSAFAYSQLVAESINKGTSSHLHSQQLFNSAQFSYHLPFQPNPLEWEMEFVEDDEYNNRKISVDDHKNHFIETHSSGEFEYTTCLKSRYLQLTSSVNKRATIPFFILHHSWKNYLS